MDLDWDEAVKFVLENKMKFWFEERQTIFVGDMAKAFADHKGILCDEHVVKLIANVRQELRWKGENI